MYSATYAARLLAVRPALYKKEMLYYNTLGGGFYKLLTGYTWLRSSDHNSSCTAQYLTASGVRNGAHPARLLAVRPALYKKEMLYYNTLGGGFLTY